MLEITISTDAAVPATSGDCFIYEADSVSIYSLSYKSVSFELR